TVTQCPPPDVLTALDPTYLASQVIAFNGGCVVGYSANGKPSYSVAFNANGSVRDYRQWSPGTLLIKPRINSTTVFHGAPSERFYGTLYLTSAYYIDLVTLITSKYSGVPEVGGNQYDGGYDNLTNQVVVMTDSSNG